MLPLQTAAHSARSSFPRTLSLCVLACTVLAASCAKKSAPQGHPPSIVTDVALTQASDCNGLGKSVRATAVRQMRAQLDAEKAYYGWVLNGPLAAAGGAAAPSNSAPVSYSTTNTQVAGVDEADFMKNDGTRIFTLAGQTLHAAKSWPAQDLALVGSLAIEGWPSEMFLDGNRVTVFSTIWTVPTGGGMGPNATRSGVAGGPSTLGMACTLNGDGCFYGWGTTKVTVVDVSDLANMKVTSQLYLPGQTMGERRVGSSIRLVLSDAVRWPEAIQWWPNYDPNATPTNDQWVAEINALEDANEAVIDATPLQNWFPNGKRTTSDGTNIDVSYSCSDFYLSNASEELGLVTIATIDLDQLGAANSGVTRASIVGNAGIIYATAEHLYLASEHWWWWPEFGQQDWTYIHAFDISDPSKASYLGSGGVPGTIQNQFAMDEQDGYLRVASSTAVYSQDPGAVDGYIVGSRLSVLALQSVVTDGGVASRTRLEQVGEIASLEENERLTAMRFVGNKGYAVTFRAIDPLVTLDLSDPAHPKKIAELTIPGFSEYVQPIDSNHLLAIGEDMPVDSNGVPDYSKRSIELSLFDVTDLTHPTRTALALVGTSWAESEAQWDHHAFNWYQPDSTKPGILAIPFADWTDTSGNDPWYGFVSDVRLFTVDPAGTITKAGALGMSDVYIEENDQSWSWWYRPWVRRSVLSTDQSGNTFVYSISDAGLRAAALNALSTPLATALYPNETVAH